MARYAATIFLSAFLLFLLQPMAGRYILPWFGGGPAVWTTCLLFFQVLLLGGYAYAHLIVLRFPARAQATLHAGLLLISLLFLPITPADTWKSTGAEFPTGSILALLTVSIGLPYLLLSATSPLLQRWFTWSNPGRSPYRLYALSNIGSLLGLLSYPFLLEPTLGLRVQTIYWSAGYFAFAMASGWCAMRIFKEASASPCNGDAETPAVASDKPLKVRPAVVSLWLGLTACGSVNLLATTNRITEDIAPIPFLWVFPLGFYLLSFIICFDSERWYHRRFWASALFISFAAVIFLLYQESYVSSLLEITIYAANLFICCMVCHGELVRLKPDPLYLTSFYLKVALGGALGACFVTLVAPRLFDDFWEFHLGLFATYALLALCVFRDKSASPGRPRQQRSRTAALVIGAALLGSVLWGHKLKAQKNVVATTRNFYGVQRVSEYDGGTKAWRRYLWHGQQVHGGQFLSPERRWLPTVYYGLESGMGFAIRNHPRRLNKEAGYEESAGSGLRIGAVGMGAGTASTYAGKGDTIRYYEINPEVVKFSDEYFYFRKDSLAREEVIIGDARISMERELAAGQPQQFDILILDAFNSDAVPVHLLTLEAFDVYWRHLRPDGILAVHISSNHLDLGPVVRGLAGEFNKTALRIISRKHKRHIISWSDWVLVTNNEAFLGNKQTGYHEKSTNGPSLIWTDDFSNLLALLK